MHQISILLTFKGRLEGGDVKQNFKDEEEKTAGADMQLEMAENLVVFACEHIAHTTGCDSVDMVLDVCYSWIAAEQGILKKATMGFDDFYIDIKKLRAENSQLKREVRRLRKELQK